MSKIPKKKICFLSALAYPLFNNKCNAVFGGAEIDLYNLAVYFAEMEDYEVTFMVGDYGQPFEEIFGNIRVRKFKYLNLDDFKGLQYKILRQIFMWREIYKLDSQIYLTEAGSELLGWLAIISKKIKGYKIIFRLAHDLDTNLQDAKKKSFKYYWLYKLGIFNADVIISQTERQQRLLKVRMGLDSQILKNGFFINQVISFEDKKYILWVARAQDWKRPELLVELAMQFPEEEFVMIMPGKNEVQDKILKSIRFVTNIRFIEYVPFMEIQKYYDGAKLFVNTSEYEGFPNAFVQACLGKTPILSFKVNPDNFIDTNRLGFCCEDDMNKAVEFIQSLDEQSLNNLGENAFKYIQDNHDMGKIGKKYQYIVESIEADIHGNRSIEADMHAE